MARELDTYTLENYAKEFSIAWQLGYWPGFPERTRPWLSGEFFKFTFMDEFEYLAGAVPKHLTGDDRAQFERMIDYLKTNHPRSDNVFVDLLATKLACDRDGNHIPGLIGTTKVGSRVIGKRIDSHGKLVNATWPIYAGEEAERILGNPMADPLPDPTKIWTGDEHLKPYKARPVSEPPPDLSHLFATDQKLEPTNGS